MKKSERTRQLIIEQAAELFNEKGVAGTSIDEVLLAAKVAKGCLYGHFQSKDELACASADYLLDKVTLRRNNLLQSQRTAVDKLIAFVEMNPNPLDDSFIHGGCPILNFGIDTDDTNPAIREKVQGVIKGATRHLTIIIKDGIAAGELSADLSAEEFAVKLFATMEGAFMMSRVMASPLPMRTAIKAMKKEIISYSLI
ncbi:TetR/AcrR family transcriptional regulator [Chitinophaga rhizophila]|uniref:TetR/AcrR family transcriptional regulator n=1 Tax=Chitinophaga rhizophila TaxID=2866212 RepID=A0ABS7G5A1_9BACT|nr:TetR/AcrR family transcriptional regulator [Chitinophaga rhizophila]MBW8682809.1 TetR/AcrR family transcriptional regulator [Chitinophaga rhizophila]